MPKIIMGDGCIFRATQVCCTLDMLVYIKMLQESCPATVACYQQATVSIACAQASSNTSIPRTDLGSMQRSCFTSTSNQCGTFLQLTHKMLQPRPQSNAHPAVP
jgi:hypothetical protein